MLYIHLSISCIFYLFIYLYRPHHMACEILILSSGIEPVPPTLEVWNLNHWTYREVLSIYLKKH